MAGLGLIDDSRAYNSKKLNGTFTKLIQTFLSQNTAVLGLTSNKSLCMGKWSKTCVFGARGSKLPRTNLRVGPTIIKLGKSKITLFMTLSIHYFC